MKHMILALTVVCMAFGLQAQKLEEIIAKNLEARGGLEKLMKLENVSMEAAMNANGMELPIKMTVAQDKGMKMEMTIMGMDNYMVVNPKEGYMYFPVQGQTKPEPMPEDQMKGMKDAFDLQGEFINYDKKGIKLEYQGEEDVDGTMCYKILCVMKDKKEKRIFIDKESNLVIKEISKAEVNGKEMEVPQEYSNYKNVDGYMMAHDMTMGMGPAKIKTIKVNQKLADDFFTVKQ